MHYSDLTEDIPSTTTTSRRSFLTAFALAVPAAWLAGGVMGGARSALAQIAPHVAAPAQFMPISRLLTGHAEISDALADAAWSALVQRNAGFDSAFGALDTSIRSSGLTAFADIPTSTALKDPAIKTTAMSIIGVWYLGRVGKVENMAEDASTFVTFADALMWAPTVNETVIPTYARGGPGHWAAPPAGATPR